jgi:regulatory protein
MSFGRDAKPARKPNVPPLEYAVKLLSARAYSEKKLREKLLAKKYAPEEIDPALKRLHETHLLDDRRYAEEFVRSRLATRPRAAIALLRELAQKGIARTIAQEVVARLAPKEEDLKLARELVARKNAQYAGLDEQTRRRRLTSLLARRGFSFETIGKVLKMRLDADDE